MNVEMSYILENGEQYDLTIAQVKYLIELGLIYDDAGEHHYRNSGEHYYHIVPDKSYTDIELALKGILL